MQMLFKWLSEFCLDWDTIEVLTENDRIKKEGREVLLINTLIDHNFLHVIFWYWIVEASEIFPTSFEACIYFYIFVLQSFVLACMKMIDKYVADVIDPQISFTSTVTLQKNWQFRERVYRTHALQTALRFMCILHLVFVGLMNCGLYNDQSQASPFNTLMHLIFLSYPALTNYIDLMIQLNNFEAKIHDCKVFANDKQLYPICDDYSASLFRNNKRYYSFVYLFSMEILGKDMKKIYEQN